jgi:hypothetical protein
VLHVAKLPVKLVGTEENRTFSMASGQEWGSTRNNQADGRQIFSGNLAADSPHHPTGESV